MTDRREKRKYLRYCEEIPVKVDVLDENRAKIWSCNGKTVNIGGGGALLEVPPMKEELLQRLLGKKYIIRLAFTMPNFFLSLKVNAETVWMETPKKTKAAIQKLGVSFKDLSRVIQDKIIDYIERREVDEAARFALQKGTHHGDK